MKKIENEKNGLIQSQKLLYGKIRRINRLFKTHFSSLVLSFLFSFGNIILWIYLVIIGQATTDLSQRYGLFGTVVTIIQTLVLFILIIQVGLQIIFYSKFIIRGNRSLKQAKDDKEILTPLYKGVVPYINNFYSFFNRYSKEKVKLSKLVSTFLFLNFFSVFFVIFLFTNLLDADIANSLIKLWMVILFLPMLIFLIINLIISIKIRNEVVKWENLFPKLEEWAQDLENVNLGNSVFLDEEGNL